MRNKNKNVSMCMEEMQHSSFDAFMCMLDNVGMVKTIPEISFFLIVNVLEFINILINFINIEIL